MDGGENESRIRVPSVTRRGNEDILLQDIPWIPVKSMRYIVDDFYT
jgi:hypothetical protein